jgi:transketolase N-terminal domain/subunit
MTPTSPKPRGNGDDGHVQRVHKIHVEQHHVAAHADQHHPSSMNSMVTILRLLFTEAYLYIVSVEKRAVRDYSILSRMRIHRYVRYGEGSFFCPKSQPFI